MWGEVRYINTQRYSAWYLANGSWHEVYESIRFVNEKLIFR